MTILGVWVNHGIVIRPMKSKLVRQKEISRQTVRVGRDGLQPITPLKLKVKEMKLTNKLLTLLAVGLVSVTCGCAGILKNPVTTRMAAEHAAYDTTVLVLAKNPEWKPKFVLTFDRLRWLEAQPVFGSQTVLDVLHNLPVHKMQGPEAALIFDGATLLVQTAGNPELNMNTQESLRLVVGGLAQGVGRRLAELNAIPAVTTKSAKKKLKKAKAMQAPESPPLP